MRQIDSLLHDHEDTTDMKVNHLEELPNNDNQIREEVVNDTDLLPSTSENQINFRQNRKSWRANNGNLNTKLNSLRHSSSNYWSLWGKVVTRVLVGTIFVWIIVCTDIGTVSADLVSRFIGGLTKQLTSALPSNINDSPDSIRYLVQNCTGDLDGLIHVLEEFFESKREKGEVHGNSQFENEFRKFLVETAAHRHRALESSLEWLLGLYRYIFPFIVLQLIMKLFGDSGSSDNVNDNVHRSVAEIDRSLQTNFHKVKDPTRIAPSKSEHMTKNESSGSLVSKRKSESFTPKHL